MTTRFLGSAALALAGLLLAGCAAPAPTPTTSEPPAAGSAEPTAAAPEPVVEDLAGTRQNPIPYGQPYTFEDIGEAGGPAWTVIIDEPRDMSVEILDAAIAVYGEDENYIYTSRPPEGSTFLGYTGSVERLMDFPAAPGYDFETDLIGTDGQTYTDLALFFTPPEDYITDISEMYAPAVSRFSDVQIVPTGTAAQQVLVTMRNTGERIYFGTAP